jgi:hypothetical protein
MSGVVSQPERALRAVAPEEWFSAVFLQLFKNVSGLGGQKHFLGAKMPANGCVHASRLEF